MRQLCALIAVCVLVVLLGSGPAAQAPPIAWAGTYAAEGSSPSGTYTATTTITVHGAAYELRWTFPRGDFMVGVGFVSGDRLIVGYEPGPGVIAYRVVRSHPLTLVAEWTAWGFTTVHTERLVKGPPAIRASR